MTPWVDPLDVDEAAEQDAREKFDADWLAFDDWLNR